VALPNPLPDNPLRWDGWKNYNSANLYERLCLSFSANATEEMIEEHCRQLLVWWQKKLPLKNQPSNPMAQMLRQGLDEAPHFLAEARTKLRDPELRKRIDAELHSKFLERAIDEFKKLLSFTLADKRLSKESEEKLYIAGEQMALTREAMAPVIAGELERVGAVRIVDEPPPPPPQLQETPSAGPVSAFPRVGASPADEFRRILKMSRLCLEGDEMSDDNRDAMCNLGESLGLTGGEAEDLIDEYLEMMATMPAATVAKSAVTAPTRAVQPAPAPQRPGSAVKPATKAPPPRPGIPAVAAKPESATAVNLSPAGRAFERQRHPNFVNRIGIEMFLIPSGRFAMGSADQASQSNEQPVTSVTLSCFQISRFPITNAQFEAFDPAHVSKRAQWADSKHPVIYVSWNEADAFCRWLSSKEGKTYRLPTEAEWEYAARGEDGRMFPWGGSTSIGHFANFADSRTNFPWRDPQVDDGFAETSPVGSYPRGASPFGIEDMSGNVFEWCLDWYEPYKGKDITNPRPSKGGRQRVYRGGSWKSRISSLRAAARACNDPNYLSNDVGFRVVCECA
jgi:formylglycine-generating enzyme required for sulfatase activity